jgi:type II secretory pathway pseudopilin PulG
MKNLKQAGMSLVEVMIGVGIAAGIGVVMMRNQDNANKMQAKTVANQDVNAAVNIIQTQLSNRAVCSMSLAGKKPGALIFSQKNVPALVDAVNNPLYNGTTVLNEFVLKSTKKHVQANTLLPGNKVRLQSMQLIVHTDGKDYLEAIFNLNPDGKKKLVGGQRIRKLFPILANKNATGHIINCYSETSNLLGSAVQQACTSLGATWDTSVTPPKCKLTNLPQCMVTPNTCSGLYSVQAASYLMKENYQTMQRKCSSKYKNMFKSFWRDCYCYGNGCTCDTGQVAGYTRVIMNQCADHQTVTLQQDTTTYRCCRP